MHELKTALVIDDEKVLAQLTIAAREPALYSKMLALVRISTPSVVIFHICDPLN
jgi:hypothetical protein